eukprot:CAMPEP_0168391338 /NCGR_PEP_ID=MMETSP0228-20121227/17935_1 /TAXON_ID=133427 /ORGANISM="Protoceratium reticulatum, Strain CCCM 535 (=CCMP 1889)" /LENGTH=430 /DNA_ID=CAMNT_0008404653 /DNA_START=12 /DNA_END=1302 /DNA_ORIENTATION=-
MAGTALSGLGATVNGLNSLYALSSQVPSLQLESAWPALAGGVASGAAALTGGCLAIAKIGVAGSGLSLSALGLGAGCVYASVGFLYFLHAVARLSTEMPPKHAPRAGTAEAAEFPSPDWLSTRVLNWGVTGRVGAGKSTLINALRNLGPRDAEAAPVGVGHTTRRPKPYNFTGEFAVLTRNMARLWDLPGAGTREWPSANYVRDAGLRHFDGVLFVTSGAFSEAEMELISQLLTFEVPYYVVRNKVDQDAFNNAQDNNTSVHDTVAEIRAELVEYGCDPARTFLISAKDPACPDFDFGALLRAMAQDVVALRGELPEFRLEACAEPAAAAPGAAAPGAAAPVLGARPRGGPAQGSLLCCAAPGAVVPTTSHSACASLAQPAQKGPAVTKALQAPVTGGAGCLELAGMAERPADSAPVFLGLLKSCSVGQD